MSELKLSTQRCYISWSVQPPLPAQLPQPTPHALCTIDCHSELTDDWIMTLSCEPLYCLVDDMMPVVLIQRFVRDQCITAHEGMRLNVLFNELH